MSGSKHRINPHQIHHVQQPLLDHSAPHSMYHQGNGILNGGSPVVMEDSSFPGLTFPFGGLDQSSMMNIPDVGFTGHIVEDFSQHHGLNSNIPTLPPHMSAMSGPAGPDFGSEQGNRRTSLEIPEEASPTEHTFGDVGTDEFGLPGNSRADGTNLGGKNSDEKAGAAPAWSELKTKAGKERKRLPLACIACRRKKIRCSGEKPACKHCLRSRIPCVYKVTTRKAAPRTDYMAMLDKRLKRMEDRIIKIIPKPEQDSASSSIARAIVKPAVPGTNSGNKSSSKKRGAEEAFGPDLEAWAKTPPKVITAGGPEDNNDSEDNVLFKEGSDALPSKEIQEHLAEIYFDNVYGQAYHLLHKPSFMRKLKYDPTDSHPIPISIPFVR
ncbi:hypothetical protein QQS21_008543 [Conoideocrella luteorostrata]|uniref:Zn(2)-C6 fungal-type domain-containing protein n=1 Tax=Conoideocrella luteorostrata TaxID=1105319 RepID=A0AAJ0CLH2_9HYPO|nr:hypothetical protein QQS21_008543 [Conoideocrella luteorostrata]